MPIANLLLYIYIAREKRIKLSIVCCIIQVLSLTSLLTYRRQRHLIICWGLDMFVDGPDVFWCVRSQLPLSSAWNACLGNLLQVPSPESTKILQRVHSCPTAQNVRCLTVLLSQLVVPAACSSGWCSHCQFGFRGYQWPLSQQKPMYANKQNLMDWLNSERIDVLVNSSVRWPVNLQDASTRLIQHTQLLIHPAVLPFCQSLLTNKCAFSSRSWNLTSTVLHTGWTL